MINIVAAAASLYGRYSYLFIPIATNLSQPTLGEAGERPGQVATLSHEQCWDKQAHLDLQLLTLESHQLILPACLWIVKARERKEKHTGTGRNPKGGNWTYNVCAARLTPLKQFVLGKKLRLEYMKNI